METLRIKNDGARILETNYWQSSLAQRGLIYCSMNAGALRILLPTNVGDLIPEMRAAKLVVASFGPMKAGAISRFLGGGYRNPLCDVATGLHLMWDDGTSSPFMLFLGAGQFDRVPQRQDNGRTCLCSVWALGPHQAPLCVLEQPGRIRHSANLPDARPFIPATA